MDPDLIRRLPKTDLHVHLDGSLRLASLIDMARERAVELPATTEAGLRETVFLPAYRNLNQYLEGFRYTVAVLQDAEALERAAFELCEDCQQEGVRYLEIRFAPQLHVHAGFEIEDVVRAVDRGIRRAADRATSVLAAANTSTRGASGSASNRRRKPGENSGAKKRIAHRIIPATKRGSAPEATSGRALNASAARRMPRSTARTTSSISNPACTCSCGAKRISR